MPVNGKKKGARGELQVVELIQEYWRQLEPEAKFYRTPGSGAWSTQHQTSSMKVRGDIMFDPATCKLWPFSVEVKFQKIIVSKSIENFIQGKRSPIQGFWDQCVAGAIADKLVPLLVFRGNRMPWNCAWGPPEKPQVVLFSSFMERSPQHWVDIYGNKD